MPKRLHASQIPMKHRRPHLNRYRAQLRDALMNPALSTEQRNDIKHRIATLGQARVYGASRVSPTSAPVQTTEQTEQEPEPVLEAVSEATTSDANREELLAKTKDELLAIAESEGVTAYKSWTNAKIVDAILANR